MGYKVPLGFCYKQGITYFVIACIIVHNFVELMRVMNFSLGFVTNKTFKAS